MATRLLLGAGLLVGLGACGGSADLAEGAGNGTVSGSRGSDGDGTGGRAVETGGSGFGGVDDGDGSGVTATGGQISDPGNPAPGPGSQPPPGPIGGQGTGGAASGGAPSDRLVAPTAEQQEACAAICNARSGVACPATESYDECFGNCNVASRSAACGSAWLDLGACAVENPTVSCGSDGEPALEGCLAESFSAYGCWLGQVTMRDPDAVAACQDYCATVAEAACDADPPRRGCTQECIVAGNAVPPCRDDWAAVIDCTAPTSAYCNDDGRAIGPGCEATVLRYFACVVDERQRR